MADTTSIELADIDRDKLMMRMAKNLPHISDAMGTTPIGIATRTGLARDRVKLIVSGKRKMKWSEYLSILFVLWEDPKGQTAVEEIGLFPDALKRAMTINRNAHGSRTELP